MVAQASVWFVLGRFAAMSDGEYFLMTPEGELTEWSEAQARDIVAQCTPTESGSPELTAMSLDDVGSLQSAGKIVSDKGLRLKVYPR